MKKQVVKKIKDKQSNGNENVKEDKNEIQFLKRKIQFLEDELNSINQNVFDVTVFNEKTIDLITGINKQILILREKLKNSSINDSIITDLIDTNQAHFDSFVKNLNELKSRYKFLNSYLRNKEVFELNKTSKPDQIIDFFFDILKKILDEFETMKKALLVLSQNDNKLSGALYEISKRLENENLDFSSENPQYEVIKTLVLLKKNYVVFDIQKSLENRAYETIITYLNTNEKIVNVYFYFNLSDPEQSKQESLKFAKKYVKKIKNKFIDIMYD